VSAVRGGPAPDRTATTGRRTCAARRSAHGRNGGFVLVGVLILLMLAALGAVQIGQRLADSRQRANEEELLYVGEQYRQAIQSYWRNSPAGRRAWPASIEDLLDDKRFPQARHHLRKAFADPLSASGNWGLVKQGNALIGVYSQAQGTPFRTSGFTVEQRGFDNASRYADWRFIAPAATAASGAAASSPSGNSPSGPRTPAPAPLFPKRGLR
jgi:type II secretory pathway pseudopilin PulG